MSSFWKILKGNGQKSDQLPQKEYENSVSFKPKNDPILICPDDEKPYLNISEMKPKNDDPILVKPQIIKSFDIVLKECSGLPYFLEFMLACEVEHYSECWIECDKFRALALSLLKRYLDKEDIKTKESGGPCTSSNLCRSVTRNQGKKKLTKYLGNIDTKNSNMLPDLVSNIPNGIAGSPMPSPEDNVFVEETFSSLPGYANDNEKQKKQNLCDNFSKLKDDDDENANLNSSLDNTKRRLVVFASEIYDQYIDINSSKSVDLPESIREVILDNIMSQNVDFNIFTHAQDFIYKFLEREYFPKYLGSEYFLRHIIDVFTSQRIFLQDILSCDSSIPYFMEYMEQEEGQPLLEFWITAFNFKEHLQKQQEKEFYNAEEAQADAMVLYEKYFSLQATHKLGFSDQVRFLVECNICQDKGPSPSCFDVPLRIVLDVIQRDYLPGYISSSLHIKFVSELVNTMKISTMGRKKRTASGSTCVSEDSCSTNRSSGKVSSISRSNTLLAMDSSSRWIPGTGSKILRNLDDPSLALRIDSNQILDPDSLWRRKNFTKLSCGYVDELGRFESDLQPEPDRKGESRLSRTLKKFVKFEENKVKEDMAYKVAEMIIKDVTNVTLGEREKPKRQQRPMSCIVKSSNDFSSPKTYLQRSSSDAFNLSLSSSSKSNFDL